MRYLDSYRVAFQSPNGTTNLLCGALCFFIPAIGPLVLMGYLLEVVEWLHAKKGAPEAGYPDFAFNRFADYLTRGIWPFLVQLVVTVPISFLILVLWGVGMGVAAATGSGVVTVIVALLLIVAYFIAIFGLNLIMVPLILRAGLSRDFATGFSFAFVKDFVGRVRKELVLSQLFLMGTSIPITLAGMLLLCVGVYPAAALVLFAFNHQAYQLYELYLQRGGEAIPMPVQAA
jgi:hypothetical protein